MPILTNPDPDVPLTDWALLWSPNYLDNFFTQRGLYEDIGTCGTLPVPWAVEKIGDAKKVVGPDGTVFASAPTGLTLTDLDLADYHGDKRTPAPGPSATGPRTWWSGNCSRGGP